jgi:tetratricopeptide (TPR) repeat protein
MPTGYAPSPVRQARLNTLLPVAENADVAPCSAVKGSPRLDGIAPLLSSLAALYSQLQNAHPIAVGAAGGALAGLGAAFLVWRRMRVPAPAADVDSDVHKLIARGELERAGDLCLERQQLARAVSMYERAGAKAKLAKVYLQTKQPAKAAKLLAELGRHAEAAHYFEAVGAWGEAGEALLNLGDERAAAELLERGGECERAARIHVRLGDLESAARLFARAGLGVEAAETLIEAHLRNRE